MSSREGWLRARAEWYTFRPPQGLHRGATPDVPRVQKGLILRTYADGHAVCIDRVRATIPDVDATWFTVGARTPMNCGGGPRVLFAFLDKEDRAKALEQPLLARTPKALW